MAPDKLLAPDKLWDSPETREPIMLIRNPDALTPSDRPGPMSPATNSVSQFTSFEVYRNGVLDHVVDGSEGLVRNRMSILYNLHPEDSWDYAPTRQHYPAAAE